MKKLYVGNLSYGTNDATLRELFAPFGTVISASVVTDRETGRSRGFGFVEMQDDAAATQAIAQLNGKTVDNRALTVNEARPQENRSRGGSGGGGGGSRGGSGGRGGSRGGGGGGYGRY